MRASWTRTGRRPKRRQQSTASPLTSIIGNALADGLQAAVIASTTDSHYAVAREFLENGVHVFIEKPVAAHPAEARKLIDLAAKKGLVLQVGHLERFSPPFRKARAVIEKPLLIEAHRIGPFTGRSTDIDVVHDLMIHDIDLVLSLVKDTIKGLTRPRGARSYGEDRRCPGRASSSRAGASQRSTQAGCRRTRERVFRVLEEGRWFSLDLGPGEMTVSEKAQRRQSEGADVAGSDSRTPSMTSCGPSSGRSKTGRSRSSAERTDCAR